MQSVRQAVDRAEGTSKSTSHPISNLSCHPTNNATI
jgi:hypothetical protein